MVGLHCLSYSRSLSLSLSDCRGMLMLIEMTTKSVATPVYLLILQYVLLYLCLLWATPSLSDHRSITVIGNSSIPNEYRDN